MNYLIYRDDGIGDLIVSTPLIKFIRENDKNSYITLICSKRNIELAHLFKSNCLIDNLINIDKYDTYFKKLSFYRIVNSLKIDHIIILKSSNFSIFLSKLIKASSYKNTYISGVVPLNSSKNGKNRYKPSKFLLNKIFDNYEVIDCRNDYVYSKDIQMLEHYSNLGNQIFKFSLKNHINNIPYFVPKELQINEDFIILTKKILYQKKMMLFHFDEKWDATDYSLDEIISLINVFIDSFDGFIFMTHGLIKNKYYDHIINNYELKNFSTPTQNYKIYISKINENLFSFPNLKLIELMYLISNSDFVIEPHGALTHIASIYNKPVIDLVPRDKINFLSKWKPRSKKMKQIVIGNKDEIIESMNEFMC
jgi:ADP-heptose:LPS heptosyltransferase